MRATAKILRTKQRRKQTKKTKKRVYLMQSQNNSTSNKLAGKGWSGWRWTRGPQACRKERQLGWDAHSELDVRGWRVGAELHGWACLYHSVRLLREWSTRRRDKVRDSTTVPMRDGGDSDQGGPWKTVRKSYHLDALKLCWLIRYSLKDCGIKLPRNGLQLRWWPRPMMACQGYN